MPALFMLFFLLMCHAFGIALSDRSETAPNSGEASTLPAEFHWTTGAPIIQVSSSDPVEWNSIKDPSIVRYGGRWHLFCTVRGQKRTHAIVYLTFSEWGEAAKAKMTLLNCHGGYFCAPQVFYFSPHRKWYLICQASHESWDPEYQPAFSTSSDISDPASWSPLKPLSSRKPAAAKAWLDFWIICDSAKAYLFFTSLDGAMWHAETRLSDFTYGWTEPVIALRDDIFEASHTYRIAGSNSYLTVVEAQHGHGWRYYKAYRAEQLDGAWIPLAAGKEHAFASMQNVKQRAEHWTDVVSHIELIRAGHDEKLEINLRSLSFLYQGVLDKDRQDLEYGAIPWRLGLMEPAK